MIKNFQPASVGASDLQDHGIAVYNGACHSMKAWRDAETGRDYVYSFINSALSVVVQIDVETGESKTIPLPAGCAGPRGTAFTLEGHILVASTCGRIARVDPKAGKSWIVADAGKWLWTMDRGADGKFYVGGSPDSQLYRFDAETGKIEDLGSLGLGQMYLRKIVCGSDGYVYCSIGCTASQVVAYHIATGKMKALLPKKDVLPYFIDVFGRGSDGQLYVMANNGSGYRLQHGEAFPLGKKHDIVKLLKVIPYWVGYVELPDGRPVIPLDPDAIQIGEGPKAKVIHYTYQTAGTSIFHMAPGPDDTMYGSTIMPLYLLRYSAKSKKLENLGRGAPDNGEIYSFGHCDGKLYYANYPSANLMVYDPAKPWHKDPPGRMKWKTNPKWLGYLGTGNCRPRAMTIDPQKRVWVGGFPEYGYRHGGLACHDIKKKKLKVFDKVIPDQSIDVLVADDTGDFIYGGSNITRGGGMEPNTKHAYLFAWDTRKNKVAWKVTVSPEMTGVSNLLYRDGKLYGTHKFHFFCFDTKTRKMVYEFPSEISGPRGHAMYFGPDGNIYGMTWMTMFRWRPESGQIEVLAKCIGEEARPFDGGSLFHRGAKIQDGRFYFTCGPKVMSMKLPLE